MGITAGNGIWEPENLRIISSGDYVRLVAPCGESRRVTPDTARRIARALLDAADRVEAREFMRRPEVERALDKLDRLDEIA